MAPTAATRRVLLLDLPRLLADLVCDVIASDAGLEVVGDTRGGEEPDRAVARAHPDFVIVGDDAAELPAWCRAALKAQPELTVLALSGDGVHAALWELVPRRTPLGELSADALLSAMHDEREWSWDA